MSQPTPYTPTTDFSQQEANNASGRSTVNTAALDAEFAAVEATLDQTLANIQLIQRDDGKLADLVVDIHTLTPEVLNLIGGFEIKGDWASSTAYFIDDLVINGDYQYVCKENHTSGVSFNSTYWKKFGFTAGSDAAQAAANAQASENAAALSEANALAYKNAAQSSATDSANSALSSSNSATAANASASSASSSATAAANSAAAAAASSSSSVVGGFKNKIINGDFRVNQRAYASAAAVGSGLYGHDRWKMAASADTYTFSTTANKTTVTIPAGKVLRQVVEGLNLQTGTYTLSWEGTAQGKIGAGAYGASGITGSITGGTNTTIEFGPGTVANVQLEIGTSATPFEDRPIGAEEQLCMRYAEAGTACRGTNYGSSAQRVNVPIYFKVKKRATPATFTISTGAVDYATVDGIGVYALSVASGGEYSPGAYFVSADL